MGNIQTVLKVMYPGVEDYTEEQMSSARRAIAAAVRRTQRSMRLPSIYIPIGGYYVNGGTRYLCVARPRVHPKDGCTGCAFAKRQCPAALQCSKFDRADNRFVWFVKEGSE